MGGQRKALLVATANYADPTFRRLRAPNADADGLAEVLTNPAIGGYQVETLRDTVAHEVALAIENLFADARLDDLLLLYISGHGVKNAMGRLYLPATNSRHDRLESTAVAAQFIRGQLDQCRARRTLVWLDCCYAGAFPPGTRHRSGEQVDVLTQLGGRGCAVMTSSSALEYSYEIDDGPEAVLTGSSGPSVFTSVLIEALRTGDADRNGDGLIDIDELYEYVFERVQAAGAPQTPTLDSRYAGRLYVATSARGQRQDVAQPPGPERVGRKWYFRRRTIITAVGAAVLLGGGIPLVLERTTAPGTASGQAGRTSSPPHAVGPGRLVATLDLGANVQQFILAFSPDGRTLATTGTRAVVKLWDVASRKEKPGITVEDSILGLSFSPDGSLLAFGVLDGTTRIWTLADRQQIAKIPNYPYQTFSPGGQMLVLGHNEDLKLWDVAKRADVGDLAGDPNSQLADTTFSPNGKLLASQDYPQQVLVWDTERWVQTASVPVGPDSYLGPAFSFDSRVLAVGGGPMIVGLWDTSTWRKIADITGHTDQIFHTHFSPVDRVLATSSDDGTVKLWDYDNRQNTATIPNAGSADFSPNGRVLAVLDKDFHAVKLWDVAGGKEAASLAGHAGGIHTLAFSPDSSLLATMADDNTVRLWDATL